MPVFTIHYDSGEKINVVAKTADAARKDGERRSKELDLGFIKKIKVQKGGAS